jgi:hypothetical protein
MTIAPASHRFLPGPRCRAGLSLLEVLIACGILALGLAGLAAMLPAAGMRLSEATIADRARFVAANAHADVLSRGLATAAACAGAVQGVAFGPLATAATGLSPGPVAADSRLFVSEDELVYSLADAGNDGRVRTEGDRAPFHTGGPKNVFFGTGPRAYRDSLVWGATLVPTVSPAQPGGSATLSIVVLRRPGEAQAVTLTKAADGSWLCAEADRQRFLKACSAVLLVAVGNSNVRPEWLSVRASWDGGTILAADAVPDVAAGSSIRVIGFENVVRVEHHAVTLQ